MLDRSRVFIFGSSGFIGRELSRVLRDKGIDSFSVGRSGSVDVLIDLENLIVSADSNFRCGDTFVFLAAVSSPEFCEKNSAYSSKINVESTSFLIKRLLDKGVTVLFASSDVVYGRTDNPVNEDSVKKPETAYACMKSEVEDKFLGHPSFKVMRLSYVWSPNDKFTSFIIESQKGNKKVEVFDPFIRSVISIKDVIDYIIKLIESSDKVPAIVNLAGPNFVSRVDLVKEFSKFIPLSYEIIRPNDDFFKYRPEQILMESKYLDTVLGRKALNIQSAVGEYFKPKCL